MTERTKVGSVQAEQESQRHNDVRSEPQRQPRYNVILWDDDEHTYQYVIRMVTELVAHTAEDSYEMAREVDRQGRVIVLTTPPLPPDRCWRAPPAPQRRSG